MLFACSAKNRGQRKMEKNMFIIFIIDLLNKKLIAEKINQKTRFSKYCIFLIGLFLKQNLGVLSFVVTWVLYPVRLNIHNLLHYE
jgi:hypothetical protein